MENLLDLNFSVGKIVLNLQRNFYRPRMQENVASFIIACILCCRINLSNRKQGIPPSHAHYLVLNVENIKLFECSMPKYVMENSPLWKGDTSIGEWKKNIPVNYEVEDGIKSYIKI